MAGRMQQVGCPFVRSCVHFMKIHTGISHIVKLNTLLSNTVRYVGQYLTYVAHYCPCSNKCCRTVSNFGFYISCEVLKTAKIAEEKWLS